MESTLESLLVEVDLNEKFDFTKKIITNIMLENKKNYETVYKISNDFVFFIDREKKRQLSVAPGSINITESKDFDIKNLRMLLNKTLDLITDDDVSKLPSRVTMEYNVTISEENSERNLYNFNSIVNPKVSISPFILTGINFVTEESETMYSIAVSIQKEGYGIEIKTNSIEYNRFEYEIEHIKTSVITKIHHLIDDISID